MGCSSSSEQRTQQPNARPVVIGQPQQPVLHVPRRIVGSDGREAPIADYELNRQNIRKALAYVAEYLHARRQALTIVTVGGAVNTLYLRSRETTHDVDFFGTHLSNSQLTLLHDAMQHAQARSSIPLGGAWLNNETQMHMSPDVRALVTRSALEQNIVVFESPGLKIVAAPWSYSFISKANRVGTQYERSYDVADAVSYLRQWLQIIADEAISTRALKDLCARYRREMLSDKTLNRIAMEYRRKYGQGGLRK